MNTEVFRIHDMNTLYKIGDLKYYDNYFMYVWGKLSFGPNLPRLTWPTLNPDRLFQISRDSSFEEKEVNNVLDRSNNPFVIKI